MRQADSALEWTKADQETTRAKRLWSAGRTTGQWVLMFAMSFALTAGVLLLAHV